MKKPKTSKKPLAPSSGFVPQRLSKRQLEQLLREGVKAARIYDKTLRRQFTLPGADFC